jgi:hypothetical protein
MRQGSRCDLQPRRGPHLQQAKRGERGRQQPGGVGAAAQRARRGLGQQRGGPPGHAQDAARQQHLRRRRRGVARTLGRRRGVVVYLPHACDGRPSALTHSRLRPPLPPNCASQHVMPCVLSIAVMPNRPIRFMQRGPGRGQARTPCCTGDRASALAGAPMNSIMGRRSAPASASASAPRMAPAPTRAPGSTTAHAPSSACGATSTRATSSRLASTGAAVTTLAVSPTCALAPRRVRVRRGPGPSGSRRRQARGASVGVQSSAPEGMQGVPTAKSENQSKPE